MTCLHLNLSLKAHFVTISYREVCLFSIIKNIVNIYINCTTYIQIHTVLYSKSRSSVVFSEHRAEQRSCKLLQCATDNIKEEDGFHQ